MLPFEAKMASFFEPYQWGVVALRELPGLENLYSSRMEHDFSVLKVDTCMTNAFNLVSHQAILSECAKHFPELLPWVSWCYGQHPLIWHSLGCLSSESCRCPTRGSTWTHAIFSCHTSNENSKKQCLL